MSEGGGEGLGHKNVPVLTPELCFCADLAPTTQRTRTHLCCAVLGERQLGSLSPFITAGPQKLGTVTCHLLSRQKEWEGEECCT